MKKNSKSFGGKIFSSIKCLARSTKKKRKKTKSLAGKLFQEKKVCAFEWSLVSSQKYIKSFGGKNRLTRFDPSKDRLCLLTSGQTLFKTAEFFFFLGTLHSQKI